MRYLSIVLLLLWGMSCAPANREELVNGVLKVDPEFSSVLDKYKELKSRIDTYERELALKRSTTERTIAQMRKDLVAAVTNVRAKTAEVKRKMEPDRQRLELALSMAGGELHTKRLQRSSLGRSIATLRKALASKEAVWTAQERITQQAQLDEMLRDAARLDQEMVALKAHVRLLKIKLLLIKL